MESHKKGSRVRTVQWDQHRGTAHCVVRRAPACSERKVFGPSCRFPVIHITNSRALCMWLGCWLNSWMTQVVLMASRLCLLLFAILQPLPSTGRTWGLFCRHAQSSDGQGVCGTPLHVSSLWCTETKREINKLLTLSISPHISIN